MQSVAGMASGPLVDDQDGTRLTRNGEAPLPYLRGSSEHRDCTVATRALHIDSNVQCGCWYSPREITLPQAQMLMFLELGLVTILE